MKPLLLIGCGGHARSLIELIESCSDWHVYGLIGLPHQVGSLVLAIRCLVAIMICLLSELIASRH